MSEMYAMHGDMAPSLQCIMQAVNAEVGLPRRGLARRAWRHIFSANWAADSAIWASTPLAERIFKQSHEHRPHQQRHPQQRIHRLHARSRRHISLRRKIAANRIARIGSARIDRPGRRAARTRWKSSPADCWDVRTCRWANSTWPRPMLLRTLDLARNSARRKESLRRLARRRRVRSCTSRKKNTAQAEPLLKQAIAQAEPKNSAYKPWYMRLLHDQITIFMPWGATRRLRNWNGESKRWKRDAGPVWQTARCQFAAERKAASRPPKWPRGRGRRCDELVVQRPRVGELREIDSIR